MNKETKLTLIKLFFPNIEISLIITRRFLEQELNEIEENKVIQR